MSSIAISEFYIKLLIYGYGFSKSSSDSLLDDFSLPNDDFDKVLTNVAILIVLNNKFILDELYDKHVFDQFKNLNPLLSKYKLNQFKLVLIDHAKQKFSNHDIKSDIDFTFHIINSFSKTFQSNLFASDIIHSALLDINLVFNKFNNQFLYKHNLSPVTDSDSLNRITSYILDKYDESVSLAFNNNYELFYPLNLNFIKSVLCERERLRILWNIFIHNLNKTSDDMHINTSLIKSNLIQIRKYIDIVNVDFSTITFLLAKPYSIKFKLTDNYYIPVFSPSYTLISTLLPHNTTVNPIFTARFILNIGENVDKHIISSIISISLNDLLFVAQFYTHLHPMISNPSEQSNMLTKRLSSSTNLSTLHFDELVLSSAQAYDAAIKIHSILSQAVNNSQISSYYSKMIPDYKHVFNIHQKNNIDF
jgi:hypothetical protein